MDTEDFGLSLAVEPGDVLVIETPTSLDKTEADKLIKRMRELLGVQQIVLIRRGAKIVTLKVGTGG